jgi:hypothetical protein
VCSKPLVKENYITHTHVYLRCETVHLHAMKLYEGVEVQLHSFLTSTIDGGEWSASRLGRFAPTKESITL